MSKFYGENKKRRSELEEACVQLKIEAEKSETLEEDLKKCYLSIKEMKKKQN